MNCPIKVLNSIDLEGSDGFEVIKHVRSREVKSDIPIIMVSGEANRADIVKATELGASDYLLKPFKKEEFYEKIDQTTKQFYNPNLKIKALRQVDQFLEDEDYEKALVLSEKAFEHDDKSHRARYTYALSLKHTGEFEKALKIVDEGIKDQPDHYKFYGLRAGLLFKLKRRSEALEALRIELELNPKQVERQIMMAELLIHNSQPKNAIPHLREALKENPKNQKALLTMAEAFFKLSDLDKSIYYLMRYRRQHPTDTKPLFTAINYCRAYSELRKAEHTIKNEINNHPTRFDAYIVLSMFHISNEDYEKAVEILEMLFKRDPEHQEGLKLRGNIYLGLKNYMAAEADYASLCKVNPTGENYLLLARARSMLNTPKEFLHAAQKAFSESPRDPDIVGMLACAFYSGKQPRKANLLARIACNKGNKTPAVTEVITNTRKSIRENQKKAGLTKNSPKKSKRAS